jgi:hypothetical protein
LGTKTLFSLLPEFFLPFSFRLFKVDYLPFQVLVKNVFIHPLAINRRPVQKRKKERELRDKGKIYA